MIMIGTGFGIYILYEYDGQGNKRLKGFRSVETGQEIYMTGGSVSNVEAAELGIQIAKEFLKR